MQVHCDEGVANHIGPEPCAGVREGVGEASVGERIGQPLSLENILPLGADAVDKAEGNTLGCVIASARTTRRGRRHWHVRRLASANYKLQGTASLSQRRDLACSMRFWRAGLPISGPVRDRPVGEFDAWDRGTPSEGWHEERIA